MDHHLHPKNRTGSIVHFQPILFNTMFNPHFSQDFYCGGASGRHH